MSVEVHRAAPDAPVPDEELQRAARAALEHGGRGELALSVVLVDDETLADLHARFLGDSSPTDVIAFDLGDDGVGPGGELYVSVDCALRVARERGREPGAELVLYVVHGALHLCGFDDRSEGERVAMRGAERAVLDGLGYAADPELHGDE